MWRMLFCGIFDWNWKVLRKSYSQRLKVKKKNAETPVNFVHLAWIWISMTSTLSQDLRMGLFYFTSLHFLIRSSVLLAASCKGRRVRQQLSSSTIFSVPTSCCFQEFVKPLSPMRVIIQLLLAMFRFFFIRFCIGDGEIRPWFSLDCYYSRPQVKERFKSSSDAAFI